MRPMLNISGQNNSMRNPEKDFVKAVLWVYIHRYLVALHNSPVIRCQRVDSWYTCCACWWCLALHSVFHGHTMLLKLWYCTVLLLVLLFLCKCIADHVTSCHRRVLLEEDAVVKRFWFVLGLNDISVSSKGETAQTLSCMAVAWRTHFCWSPEPSIRASFVCWPQGTCLYSVWWLLFEALSYEMIVLNDDSCESRITNAKIMLYMSCLSVSVYFHVQICLFISTNKSLLNFSKYNLKIYGALFATFCIWGIL